MLRLILCALMSAAPAFAQTGSAFRVVSVQGGRLTVDGKPAGPGLALRAGQELRLDAGQAVLAFGTEGGFLLTGPAVFIVEDRGASLKSGGLLSVLDKLRGAFSVETPTAVASVRGTNFYIEARGERQTYLCLCKGKVEVRAADGSGFRSVIKAKHHAPYLFSRGEKGITQAAAKMEHHTDEQIASLLKRR